MVSPWLAFDAIQGFAVNSPMTSFFAPAYVLSCIPSGGIGSNLTEEFTPTFTGKRQGFVMPSTST